MKKKILYSFLALIILIYPVSNAMFPQHADAFVSKLFGLSAKKIAKEAIKDIAVDTAANFAINEAFKIAEAEMAKYNQKEAYKIVCLQALTGEVCDKPMQIKENLTEADKIAIGRQAEIELEKAINGGAGFTKWQKFLDWFGPVWITSFVMTAITYAIDTDVRDMFNNIAYDSLVALGLITPVETKEPKTIVEQQKELPEPITTGTVITTDQQSYTSSFTGSPMNSNSGTFNPSMIPENIIYQSYITSRLVNITQLKMKMGNYYPITINYSGTTGFVDTYIPSMGNVEYVNLIDVNENITTLTTSTAKSGSLRNFIIPETEVAKMKEKSITTNKIVYRPPFIKDGAYFTDVQIVYTDNTSYKIQIKHDFKDKTPVSIMGFEIFHNSGSGTPYPKVTGTTYFNQSPLKMVYPPSYTEVALPLIEQIPVLKEDHIALVPPIALPYKKISDGTPVYPEDNPEYDPVTNPEAEPKRFVDGNGTPVPDDEITVGDPDVQDNPDPTKTEKVVYPPPSPSNPTPEPIPLTPTIPTTPPPQTPPPPIETLPPVFPEGESCEVGLKLPKISPLAYAVSEAFPFSIPFDLYDGFQAIFSEMGNEKPEFNYKLDFMGEQQEWKISIPDYFDSWKRFTDSFIIFIFDVGIIFMIFRFMGGSK